MEVRSGNSHRDPGIVVFAASLLAVLITILCFVKAALDYRSTPIESSELMKSAALIFGFLLPSLTTAAAYYHKLGVRPASPVSESFYWIIITCSMLYTVLLVALAVLGIAFQGLVPSLESEALYRNCVAVVTWLGFFAPLTLPAAWLFGQAAPAESTSE